MIDYRTRQQERAVAEAADCITKLDAAITDVQEQLAHARDRRPGSTTHGIPTAPRCSPSARSLPIRSWGTLLP